MPGPETDQMSRAADAHDIYVIVGCWETLDDSRYANTALIFDREGDDCGQIPQDPRGGRSL